jgi:hypothetical protein
MVLFMYYYCGILTLLRMSLVCNSYYTKWEDSLYCYFALFSTHCRTISAWKCSSRSFFAWVAFQVLLVHESNQCI